MRCYYCDEKVNDDSDYLYDMYEDNKLIEKESN